MYAPAIVAEAVVNGLLTGSVYALIALGLTLVYGVLHIINFAHGALLTCAMFAVWVAHTALGLDPYLAIPLLTPLFFGLGYVLQRFVIGPASRGNDSNILLVTLGLAIAIENALLATFRSDTRTLSTDYGFQTVELGPLLIAKPRLIGFAAALATTSSCGWRWRAPTPARQFVPSRKKSSARASSASTSSTSMPSPSVSAAPASPSRRAS